MNRKPRTHKDLFPFASRRRGTSHPASRWQIVLIALALVTGSVGQTSQAQAAADNPADVYFEVSANPQSPPPLCINQQLKIYVSINKNITKVINEKAYNLPRGAVTGVKVTGSMSKDVGTLESKKPEVSFGDDELAVLQPKGIGQADFVFTAKKPGTTTLTFTANVPGAWTGSAEALALGKSYPANKAEIKVRVIPCKFKVKTASNFSAQGVNLAAIMDGEMKADEQGNFTGSATVNWIGGFASFGTCGAAYYDVASSQADLTGRHDDEGGQLAVEVNYLGAVLTMSGCASASGTVVPDPLALNIPSSGGVSTQSQDLHEPNYFSFYGSAVIVVTPVEDGAVSFNPAGLAARVGSPSTWLTELWDNFPWLNDTMLALYQ